MSHRKIAEVLALPEQGVLLQFYVMLYLPLSKLIIKKITVSNSKTVACQCVMQDLELLSAFCSSPTQKAERNVDTADDSEELKEDRAESCRNSMPDPGSQVAVLMP